MSEIAKSVIPAQASSSFKSEENLNNKIQKLDYLSRQA